MRPPPGTSSPRCWPSRAGVRPGAPRHSDHLRQLRPLDRKGRGSGRRPGPVRRAAGRPRTRVRGQEHPETLTDRANLANWTGYAGDPAAARDQLAALIPVRERMSGPDHPETLAARGNLAYWTGQAGDRPPPGTCSPRCWLRTNGSAVRNTTSLSPSGASSRTGPSGQSETRHGVK